MKHKETKLRTLYSVISFATMELCSQCKLTDETIQAKDAIF